MLTLPLVSNIEMVSQCREQSLNVTRLEEARHPNLPRLLIEKYKFNCRVSPDLINCLLK